MATVDAELLRRVCQRLRGVKFVTETTVCPTAHPDSAVVALDGTYYPAGVRDAVLFVRAYRGGSFNIIYREEWGGTAVWTCRWDRHDNPHNTRDHFHEPPDATTVRDRSYPADFFAVIRIVLEAIEQRLGEIWDEQNQP